MSKLINFTCEECEKTGLTEADGLEMESGFVCTDCLYATSTPVTEDYLEDPTQEGHDTESRVSYTVLTTIVTVLMYFSTLIIKHWRK
jgi:hypothetical protein